MSEIAISVVIALVAALPGVLALFAQRKKNAADAAGMITDAAMDILDRADSRIEKLEFNVNEQSSIIELQTKKIREMNKDLIRLDELVREYRRGLMILIAQVESLGDNPAYRIKDK